MFKLLGETLDSIIEAIGMIILCIIVLIGWVVLSIYDGIRKISNDRA